jgi:uncharacterized protein YcnI
VKTTRKALAGAAVAGLALPACAWAHGTIRPGLAAPGSTQEFTVLIPVTAQSPPVVGLSVTAPRGVNIVSAASAPPRWSATVRGATVTWRGGPIPPGSFDSFGFKASLPPRPGPVSFDARELYAGGAAPPFKLSVVLFERAAAPSTAANDDGTRTLALFALVLAIVAVVLAGAALVVSLARWLRG